MDTKRNIVFAISAVIITTIYLVLRLSFPETIEFSYDQPKTANIIINFIKDGTYLTSQNYTQETIGGVVAWGPSLNYILAPFLMISKDPIFVSQLISIFNILSIFVVMLIGYLFYNKRVAIISGLTLATIPLWFIFSRMIYQPSLIPTFISISILLLFLSLQKLKSIWTIMLFLSWGILIQMYLITYSFVIVSVLMFAYSIFKKTIPSKEILIGILLNIVIFIPSIFYYINRLDLIALIFTAEKSQIVTFGQILNNYINVLSGGGMKWQLGYAYQDFLIQYNISETYYSVASFILFVPVIYTLFSLLRNRNMHTLILSLFLFSPLWALPLVGIEYMVPRYFLYILPAFAIMIGISFDLVIQKFGKLLYLLPISIFIFWLYEIYSYNSFVKTYTYDEGVLSSYSDVPYSFVVNSFEWINKNSKENNCENYELSNVLNLAQSYYYQYNNKINNTADCLYTMEYKYSVVVG
ncbi:MAG: hypothetical protein WA152_01745, partial [Microgenomates group bacterium]